MFAGLCKWYNKKMATDDKRISSKRLVEGGAIILSDNNEELVWMSPKGVIVRSGNEFSFDKYLGNSPFKTFGGDLIDDGSLVTDDKDTVHLTDIESITYEPYYTQTKELKFRAILKIRNSSKTKEDVVGVDARTANLEAKN